jgi:hypothetical protein
MHCSSDDPACIGVVMARVDLDDGLARMLLVESPLFFPVNLTWVVWKSVIRDSSSCCVWVIVVSVSRSVVLIKMSSNF